MPLRKSEQCRVYVKAKEEEEKREANVNVVHTSSSVNPRTSLHEFHQKLTSSLSCFSLFSGNMLRLRRAEDHHGEQRLLFLEQEETKEQRGHGCQGGRGGGGAAQDHHSHDSHHGN